MYVSFLCWCLDRFSGEERIINPNYHYFYQVVIEQDITLRPFPKPRFGVWLGFRHHFGAVFILYGVSNIERSLVPEMERKPMFSKSPRRSYSGVISKRCCIFNLNWTNWSTYNRVFSFPQVFKFQQADVIPTWVFLWGDVRQTPRLVSNFYEA